MDLVDKAVGFASGYWLASCNNTDLFGNEYIDLNITPFDKYEGREVQEDDLVAIHRFTLLEGLNVEVRNYDFKILGRVHITDDIRGLTTLYMQDESDDILYIIEPHTCEIIEAILGDSTEVTAL